MASVQIRDSDDEAGLVRPAEAQVGSPELRLRHRLMVAALSLLILALGYVILRELTGILRPLLVAALLCYLIVPAHRRLVRYRVPSLLAHVLIMGTALVAFYAIGVMTVRSLGQMRSDLPNYVQALSGVAERTVRTVKDRIGGLMHVLPESRPSADDESEPAAAAAGAAATTGPGDATALPFEVSTEHLLAMGRSALEATLDLFSTAVIVIFYLIFLLAELAGFERRVAGAFGRERAAQIMAVTGKINAAVAQFIAVKTFTSLLIAAFTVLVLVIFGVRYALIWGILTFFGNFIPYIGSLVAVALPVLMALVQFGGISVPLALTAILSGAQVAIGYVIEPRMIGHRLGVSPLMIVLSLAFWGFLWGIAGMILAVPLTVLLKIVLENIEQTRPIARMMSDA